MHQDIHRQTDHFWRERKLVTKCQHAVGGRMILTRDAAGNLVCFQCWKASPKAKPMTGLGDLVAAATATIGIKPCTKCKKRQEKLNKLVPFTPSDPSPSPR